MARLYYIIFLASVWTTAQVVPNIFLFDFGMIVVCDTLLITLARQL